MNTGAVTFVSGRNNLVAAFFPIIAVTLHIDATRKPSRGLAIASGISFFLKLLSKEPALMALPFMAA